MPRDYQETIKALRRKAADPAVPEPERNALTKKADALESRHQDTKLQDIWNSDIPYPWVQTLSASPKLADILDDLVDESFNQEPTDEDGVGW